VMGSSLGLNARRVSATTVSSNQSRRISPYFELSRESVST